MNNNNIFLSKNKRYNNITGEDGLFISPVFLQIHIPSLDATVLFSFEHHLPAAIKKNKLIYERNL